MLKVEKEYDELYGDIPVDSLERVDRLLKDLKYKKTKYADGVYGLIHKIITTKWESKKFVIYLLPKATPRPRSGKSGIFYVKGAKDNKKIFEKFISNQDIDIITTPVKFKCVSYFPIPKSMHKVEQIVAELGFLRPVSKPDWDNVAKAYCDMIQGYLIEDDSLVVDGVSRKFYSTKPRIEITIEYMTDYDSIYNMQKILNKKKKEK